MPKARVRLSAGRQQMNDALPALCFLAGANSIFYGDKLLTAGNLDTAADVALLERLGMRRVCPRSAVMTPAPASPYGTRPASPPPAARYSSL